MKLSEFQAGHKALATEIAKIIRADIFETTSEQRTYTLNRLEAMSASIRQADKICALLDTEPNSSGEVAPVFGAAIEDAVPVTNVVNISATSKEDEAPTEEKPTTKAGRRSK